MFGIFPIYLNTTTSVKTEVEYDGLYVMDPSYGLNFMNVDCDSINPVQMGLVYKDSLLLCPVQLPGDINNSNQMVRYSPTNHRRKLKAGIIDSFRFWIVDLNDEKIYFNSGKVIIVCTIT